MLVGVNVLVDVFVFVIMVVDMLMLVLPLVIIVVVVMVVVSSGEAWIHLAGQDSSSLEASSGNFSVRLDGLVTSSLFILPSVVVVIALVISSILVSVSV